MARARNIKPSFFNNDELAEISAIGRLLFIGMWTIADYKGDIIWREKRIKAQVLPYDNCDVKEIAINLDNCGFIRFYSDGDKIYLNICNFTRHQNPHKNERDKGSEIPHYSEEMRQAVDLKGLTINPDKTRQNPEHSNSDRADSLNLIPDSLNPPTGIDIEIDTECSKGKNEYKGISLNAMPEELSISDFEAFVDYKIKLAIKEKKPAPTDRGIKMSLNQAVKVNKELGISYEEIFAAVETGGWKGIKFEYFTDKNLNKKFDPVNHKNTMTREEFDRRW